MYYVYNTVGCVVVMLILFSIRTIDFYLIAHVPNQIIAVPAVASVLIGSEIRFWCVWTAMDDIVTIDVDSCWLHLHLNLRFVSLVALLRLIFIFCSFGFVPRRLLVVGPFNNYYPHPVGSFSTLRLLLLRTVKTTN